MLNNPYVMPNPFLSSSNNILTLGLQQIANYPLPEQFTDSGNTVWKLIKAYNNTMLEVPDWKSIQITDYWNHVFPNLEDKIYIYVVEGIRQPRIQGEQAAKLLYSWFSKKFVQQFTPQMITEQEWRIANVYASELQDTRVSKLEALCNIPKPLSEPEEKNTLITIKGFK